MPACRHPFASRTMMGVEPVVAKRLVEDRGTNVRRNVPLLRVTGNWEWCSRCGAVRCPEGAKVKGFRAGRWKRPAKGA